MNRNTLFALSFAVALSTACGDSSSSVNNDNAMRGNNSAANNSAPIEVTLDGIGWAAAVAGGDVALPDAGSTEVTATVSGGTLIVEGAKGEGPANLTISFPVTDLQTTQYTASIFSLGYSEPAYQCTQESLMTVTITSTAPIEGSFEGDLRCQSFAGGFIALAAGKFAAAPE